MAENNKTSSTRIRMYLAYGILALAGITITLIAIYAMRKNDGDEAITILNMILPMFASWVGMILAFYFGQENFESANQEVRKLVDKLTPEERAETSIASIMRPLDDMDFFQITKGKGDQDIKLSELSNKYNGSKVSRLPIIDADKKPKYMIHESSISKYITTGGKSDDTLEAFITTQSKEGFVFGLNKGFVIVSEQSTLATAKKRMEGIRSCQDIFITKEGSPNESLIGWVSNIRMAKFLKT